MKTNDSDCTLHHSFILWKRKFCAEIYGEKTYSKKDPVLKKETIFYFQQSSVYVPHRLLAQMGVDLT